MTKPHPALLAVGWILIAITVVGCAVAGWSATTAGARWVGLGLAGVIGSGVVIGLVLRGESAARRRTPQVRSVAHPAGVRIVGLGVTDALVRIWLLGIVVGVGAAGVTALVHAAWGGPTTPRVVPHRAPSTVCRSVWPRNRSPLWSTRSAGSTGSSARS